MTSFSIQNFGCRVNQAEAFDWARKFQRQGLKLEREFAASQLILVNTCTLTCRADRDARRFIRKMARLNPQAKLVVTGCLVERRCDEFQSMPEIWKIFSNTEKRYLVEKILSEIEPQKSVDVLPFRSRALLKVQDGCNLSCSYCIIPSVRGKSVSLPKEEVLSRSKRLAEEGFKEIILTGIHLCSFGLDLKPKSSLLDLLRDMENIEKLNRVRLSSLDPRLLSSPLADEVCASRKICPHFHLSLQHGSDSILQMMGRESRLAEYKELLASLRSQSPAASLGADIIVGFPRETDDDFSQVYEFLENSPLTYFHVFSYSPRPGTPSSRWPQVEEKKKKERAALLRELSREKNFYFRCLFEGKSLEAVVIKKDDGSAEALTPNYIKVFLPSCPPGEGEEVRLKINRVSEEGTIGEIVKF